MKEITITVGKKIRSTNTLLCRRCSARLKNEKDDWAKHIKGFLNSVSGVSVFNKKVEIIISSFRKRFLDKDNLFTSVKAIIDSIKVDRSGLIVDDSPKHIIGPKVNQFKSKNERTEILIREVE